MINKEIKAVYNKRYYDKHRKTILNYMKTKIQCECGCMISRIYKSTHMKTKKHHYLMGLKSKTIHCSS